MRRGKLVENNNMDVTNEKSCKGTYFDMHLQQHVYSRNTYLRLKTGRPSPPSWPWQVFLAAQIMTGVKPEPSRNLFQVRYWLVWPFTFAAFAYATKANRQRVLPNIRWAEDTTHIQHVWWPIQDARVIKRFRQCEEFRALLYLAP